MSIPRLFTDAALHEGAELPAAEGQGAYLAQVLRRRAGDAVRLFNGRDGEWEGIVASLSRDRAVLRAERRAAPQRGVPDVTLLLAVLKRDAMEAAVQAAVELGVARIVPVLAARSVPDRVNVARLALIAREAAEQCERMEVPEIAAPIAFAAALDGWAARAGAAAPLPASGPAAVPRAGDAPGAAGTPGARPSGGDGPPDGAPAAPPGPAPAAPQPDPAPATAPHGPVPQAPRSPPLFIAAERRGALPLPRALAGHAPPLGLLVGPEGGFTAPELDAALARPFVVPATLGPRILRARTAAAAGLAVLMAAVGDWTPTEG
jgi:16S rRNA (uracil1498-N3)-methyltransferase